MKPKIGRIKEFKQVYGIPPAGHFAPEIKPPRTVCWHNCREQFGNYFNEDSNGFFFSHYANIGTDVAAFINTTEAIIGLSQLSTFQLTENSQVIWIAPSEFWKICRIRRSLLTLLLRCSLDFSQEKENYDEALFSTKLAKETSPAIMRFLFGFTKFVGELPQDRFDDKVGWHSVFYMLKTPVVRRLLVSENEYKPMLLGSGALWN